MVLYPEEETDQPACYKHTDENSAFMIVWGVDGDLCIC